MVISIQPPAKAGAVTENRTSALPYGSKSKNSNQAKTLLEKRVFAWLSIWVWNLFEELNETNETRNVRLGVLSFCEAHTLN